MILRSGLLLVMLAHCCITELFQRGRKDSSVSTLFLSRAMQVHDSVTSITHHGLNLEIFTLQSRSSLKNVLKIESVGDYYLWKWLNTSSLLQKFYICARS